MDENGQTVRKRRINQTPPLSFPRCADVLTEYAGCSGCESGRCHFGLDRIPRTTMANATIKTPNEFPNTASGGRRAYGCVPLAVPFLWGDFFLKKMAVLFRWDRNLDTHRLKNSFSLIPETQATTLSDRMLPPNHT